MKKKQEQQLCLPHAEAVYIGSPDPGKDDEGGAMYMCSVVVTTSSI